MSPGGVGWNNSHSVGPFIANSEKTANKLPVFFEELKKNGTSPQETREITARIERGRTVFVSLLGSEDLPISTKESALDLTWFLTALGYQENDKPFVRGVIRLELSEEQSKRMKHFYGNCAEAGAHNRPSSHFQEMTKGHQKGVDFEKGSLPFDKELSTLLCGRLDDGSFFIKLETQPLSLLNPIGSIRHLSNWFFHSLSGGGKQLVNNQETRRETDKVEEAASYTKKAISAYNSMSPKKPIETEKLTRIFQMNKLINEISDKIDNPDNFVSEVSEFTDEESNTSTKSLSSKENSQKTSEIKEHSTSFKKHISEIKYPDIASGMEVIIPAKRLNDFI